MNILLLGSGGREHALAWALRKSPKCERLIIAPGNGGTAVLGENVSGVNINSGEEVLDLARKVQADLVVIGPEAPLVAGVADVLRAECIAVFGPAATGARLEGSKDFAKQFMSKHNIPTAAYKLATSEAQALQALEEMGAPVVVKADGLAAGKGVVVAQTVAEAKDAIKACFNGAFGDAGSRVLLEECLSGPECSMLAFVSAGKCFCMTPSQDHKRALEGDLGPNTGGMGVYSPVPIVTPDELAQMEDIMARAAAATAQDFDTGYAGCLYGGFMLTEAGPKIIEFNARFGDPETQVVLPRLETDLVEVMCAVAAGTPEDIQLKWSDNFAVSVVLASAGYPGAYEKGKEITGIEDAEALSGVVVFHAGTKAAGGKLFTNGGRVLNVTALAPTFEQAREQAYKAADLISFEGKQFRRDIGLRALRGRSAWE